MTKRLAAILIAVTMSAVPCASAQDKVADLTDIQALRAAVRTDKRALVESTLKLSDVEAKKFWPTYDTYQRHLAVTTRERAIAIEESLSTDRDVSNLYAKKLVKAMLATDEADVKARRSLHNSVLRALPAKKAARYLQLEAKIRAIQAYDIAATIPLVK